MRKLFISDINDKEFARFRQEFRALESKSKKPILIDMNSDGGNGYTALAFAALLRTSKCKTIITVYGWAASAAVLVLASATERIMTKESWVMVHEDSGDIDGELKTMEVEIAQLRRAETQWCALLEERTGTSRTEWESLHKKTTYLTAQECLDLGLIERIV